MKARCRKVTRSVRIAKRLGGNDNESARVCRIVGRRRFLRQTLASNPEAEGVLSKGGASKVGQGLMVKLLRAHGGCLGVRRR